MRYLSALSSTKDLKRVMSHFMCKLTMCDTAEFFKILVCEQSHVKTRVSDLLLEECPTQVAPWAPSTLTEPQTKRKLLSHVSDSCDPMDCSPPDSCVHRILQARILEWVAISFSNLLLKAIPWGVLMNANFVKDCLSMLGHGCIFKDSLDFNFPIAK